MQASKLASSHGLCAFRTRTFSLPLLPTSLHLTNETAITDISPYIALHRLAAPVGLPRRHCGARHPGGGAQHLCAYASASGVRTQAARHCCRRGTATRKQHQPNHHHTLQGGRGRHQCGQCRQGDRAGLLLGRAAARRHHLHHRQPVVACQHGVWHIQRTGGGQCQLCRARWPHSGRCAHTNIHQQHLCRPKHRLARTPIGLCHDIGRQRANNSGHGQHPYWHGQRRLYHHQRPAHRPRSPGRPH